MKQQQFHSGHVVASVILGVSAWLGTALKPKDRHGSNENLRPPEMTAGAKVEQRKPNENAFRWAVGKPADPTSSHSLLSGLRARSRAAAQLPKSSLIAEVPMQSAERKDALRELVHKALQWQGTASAAAINAGADGTGRDGIGTAKRRNRLIGLSRQGQSLVQQGSARFLRRGTRHLPGPHNMEEGDYMYGLPKIVWIILADVMAVAVFLICIPLAILHAKQPIIEEVSVADQLLKQPIV